MSSAHVKQTIILDLPVGLLFLGKNAKLYNYNILLGVIFSINYLFIFP